LIDEEDEDTTMDINMLTISKEGKVKGFGKGVIDENEPPVTLKLGVGH